MAGPTPPRPVQPAAQPREPRVPRQQQQQKAGPSTAWIMTGAVLVVAEIILVFVMLARQGVLMGVRYRFTSLENAQRQADDIREAWTELTDQGALLRARMTGATTKVEDLAKRIKSAADRTGLAVTISPPVKLTKPRFGVTPYRIRVSASGSEKAVLNFLVALDEINALVEVDDLDLTGTDKGRVDLKLGLRHYTLSKGRAKAMEQLVKELPASGRDRGAGGPYKRGEALFIPVLAPEEDALAGWPKITLDGFSQEQALMTVGGTSKSLKIGDAVVDDIVYLDKPSVNQAVLRRTRDKIEVILTVGSPSFSLRASEVRGMSEFIITLQKRTSSDMLSGSPGR